MKFTILFFLISLITLPNNSYALRCKTKEAPDKIEEIDQIFFGELVEVYDINDAKNILPSNVYDFYNNSKNSKSEGLIDEVKSFNNSDLIQSYAKDSSVKILKYRITKNVKNTEIGGEYFYLIKLHNNKYEEYTNTKDLILVFNNKNPNMEGHKHLNAVIDSYFCTSKHKIIRAKNYMELFNRIQQTEEYNKVDRPAYMYRSTEREREALENLIKQIEGIFGTGSFSSVIKYMETEDSHFEFKKISTKMDIFQETN